MEKSSKIKAVRKKGIERRNQILSTIRGLLRGGAINDIALGDVAKSANIPASSIYHFYASVDEILVDLIEEFRKDVLMFMEERGQQFETDSWQALVDWLVETTKDFYVEHHEYQQLILSGQAKANIKLVDRDSDDLIAKLIVAAFNERFDLPRLPNFEQTSYIALEIVDLIFSLSVQKYGEIRKEYVEEAKLASKSYLRAYLPEILMAKVKA